MNPLKKALSPLTFLDHYESTNLTSQRPQNRILPHLAIPQDLGCTDATVVPEVRTFIIHQDHVLQPTRKKNTRVTGSPGLQ